MAEQQTQTLPVRVVRMMSEGAVRIPSDSGSGHLWRPFGIGHTGGRFATFETLWDYFIDVVPDPDSALAQNPQFDEVIRQHPDVHACMRLRELTVASMPCRIEPSKAKGIDRDFAQTVADYTSDVFDALPNRIDLYRQMQKAVLMGGVGHEFVWAEVDGYERPVQFFSVDKSRFVFDRLGRMSLLTRQTPVWGTYIADTLGNDIKQIRFPNGTYFPLPAIGGKFMYHKYMAEGGTWMRPAAEGYQYWGRGEDTHLFMPVTFDQFVLRFQLKWLEKHGMPLTTLYYPENSRPANEVLNIAKSLREESVIRIPRPVGAGEEKAYYSVEFQDPPSQGYDAFMEFHQRWTRTSIERIMLGGANLMELGESGSYSATVGQRDAGADIIFRYDGKNIDETLNQQLIPFIVQARWPGIKKEYYPKHVLEPKREEDQEVRMRVIESAAGMVEVREQDIYEAAGLQRPKKAKDGDVDEDEPTVFLGGDGGNEPGMFDQFPTTTPNPRGKKKPPQGNSSGEINEKRPKAAGKANKATPIGKSNTKGRPTDIKKKGG